MAQHQRQSISQASPDGQPPQEDSSQGPSLSPAEAPDPTSPYKGPPAHGAAGKNPADSSDSDPSELEHPYFSEAQSTFGAFAPVDRDDHFPQPEDPQARRTEQPGHAGARPGGAEFATQAGTVREGMEVVDAYGHTIGIVAAIEGARMRLSSTDPHDDGVAFLPVSLIAGIEDQRVLLTGRGDASFGIAAD